MFSKAFQKGDGGVEIFSPTGTDPLRSLELKNKSAISKVYDRYIKGNCLILDQTSVSSSISCPSSSSKTLGIVQPWFCLQLNIPKGKSFSLELVVSETTGQHHRVHFSTSFRGWDANELHARIAWPKEYDSLWVTYVINLEELCRVCFRSTFASLDHFTVYSTCQLKSTWLDCQRKLTKVQQAHHPNRLRLAPKQLTASTIAANTQVIDETHVVPESKTVEQRGPHPKGAGGKLMHGTLQKAEEKQRTPRRDEIVPFDDDDDHDNELLVLGAVDAHTERSLDDAKSYPMNGSNDRARVSYSHQVSQEKPPDRDLSNPWGGAASPAKEAFYNDSGRGLPHADPHPIASPISSSSRQRPATSEHNLHQSAAKAANEAEAKATPRRPPLDSKDLRDAEATNEWELVQQLLRTQERNPWQTSLPSSPSLVAPSRSSATAAASARSSSFGLQRSIVDGVIDGGHSEPSETPSRRSIKSVHAAESPSSDRWGVRSSDADGALLPHARPVPVPQSVLLAQESGEPHSDIFASSVDASVASRDVRLSIGTAPLRPVGQSPAQSVEAFGAQDGDGRSEAVDWRPHGDYVYPSSARTLRSPSPDPPAEGPRERDTRLVQASQSVENFLAARRQTIDQEPVDQHVFASIQRWEERITQLLVVNDTDSLRLPTAPTAVHEVHDLCDSLKRLECEFWRSFGREDYEQDVGYFEFE
eukprot:gene2148-1568_t